MMPYEELQAWQAAHRLVIAVYRKRESFPKHELYGLTSQMRRAAFSVAANIAEGVAKRGSGELRRFLDIAIGSLAEVAYIIRLAKDLSLLTPEAARDVETLRVVAAKLTWGLYKSASRRLAARASRAGPTAGQR
jgi:four helix bundle protein